MRYENWLEALNKYIGEVYDKPFKWGVHDCCHFAGRCVEVMTGDNPMKGIKYKSKLGANKLMKAIPLDERLTELFGSSVPVAFAKRGDLVYTEFGGCPCVGVSVGKDALFVGFDGHEGLITVSVADCDKAFRIEF